MVGRETPERVHSDQASSESVSKFPLLRVRVLVVEVAIERTHAAPRGWESGDQVELPGIAHSVPARATSWQ